jgi:hypothetical protein
VLALLKEVRASREKDHSKNQLLFLDLSGRPTKPAHLERTTDNFVSGRD